MTGTEESKGEKIDEIQDGERKLSSNGDVGALGEVLVSRGSGFAGVNYEMEEGEIVEDDGLVDFGEEDYEKSKENLHSDVESGEIEPNRYDHSNTEVDDEVVESLDKNTRKLAKDGVDGQQSSEMDKDGLSSPGNLTNGDCSQKCHEVDDRLLNADGKRASKFVDEVERRSPRKSSSSEKRPRAVSPSYSHDKYPKDSSHSNLSKSPEWSRGRSRSQSIVREISREDSYYIDGKHHSESDDERVSSRYKNYRRSSKDHVMEKERERSSGRYMERMERHYSREDRKSVV